MAGTRCVVGVIGAIGSGKTTAARQLAEELQAPLIIADESARELAQPGGPLAGALEQAFPGLDRAAIATRIFTEPAAMQRLAALTDPPLIAELRRRLAALPDPLVIVEGVNLPVLVPELVGVWLEIAAPEKAALARAGAGHRWPRETIRACWHWQQAQVKPEPRRVIDNGGTLDLLAQQVRELAGWLRAETAAAG